MTVRINGQDVATGDIDDGRPERILIPCDCFSSIFGLSCPDCGDTKLRDETDEEYWARVEAMTPNCKEDLL